MRKFVLVSERMTQLLNWWKEIAAHLGRGVRTAQRWERDLRLPVRRPRGKDRSAVIAFTYELDHWLKQTENGSLHVNQRFRNVVAERKLLQENTRALEQNIQLLQQNIVRMIRISRAHSLRSEIGRRYPGSKQS
jgi:hypothetical protein